MKLVTYAKRQAALSQPTAARLGAVRSPGSAERGPDVVDLLDAAQLLEERAAPELMSLQAWLDGGPAARDSTQRLLEKVRQHDAYASQLATPLDSVQLLAPLPVPRSLRDCMVFQRHWIQAARRMVTRRVPWLGKFDAQCERLTGWTLFRPARAWFERPLYYKGNCRSVVGHDAAIWWPSYTEQLDFEIEIGVFVGKCGRNLTEQQAADAIAGYAIFNDFSARDVQRAEMAGRLGPAKCKDFDTGNSIGPWLTTPDEVPDPGQLNMEVRVNNSLWSQTSSRDMQFSFPQILAFISRDETLYPGDFIASGTPPYGCGLELDRWLQPGDTIELAVERLGVLRNHIVRA